MATATATGPEALTERQAEIHRFIYEHARDRGYQPSQRDIKARFRILSPNGCRCHLLALARKGWVDIAFNHNRCIRILRRPDGELFTGFADK